MVLLSDAGASYAPVLFLLFIRQMSQIDLSAVTTVIHLATKNDLNGNSNRVYVAFAGSTIRGVWDEGCEGHQAVPAEIRELAFFAPRINTTPGEIKRIKRWAASLIPELCEV